MENNQILKRSHLLRKASDYILKMGNQEFFLSQIKNETGGNVATSYKVKNILTKEKIIEFVKKTGREKYFKLTPKGDKVYQELTILKNIIGWKDENI